MLGIVVQSPHLDVSVDADGGIVDALQAFEGHRALLLVVDEEDDDASREIQQDSDCGSFRNAAVRPARREEQQIKKDIKKTKKNPIISLLSLHQRLSWFLSHRFSYQISK